MKNWILTATSCLASASIGNAFVPALNVPTFASKISPLRSKSNNLYMSSAADDSFKNFQRFAGKSKANDFKDIILESDYSTVMRAVGPELIAQSSYPTSNFNKKVSRQIPVSPYPTKMSMSSSFGGGDDDDSKKEDEELYYDGVRLGPPPDLPSLLLHNRIIYLGMPLVPAVTELLIAEFLYMNFDDYEKFVNFYINSPGTTMADGRSAAFETEAFAVADTIQFIRSPIQTVAVGQAYGTAAMLLSLGTKGHRTALPNTSIMLHQPRSMARGQASDIAIKAREVIHNRRVVAEFLAQQTGHSVEKILKDSSRVRYLSPEEAMEYGLIDKMKESEYERFDKPPLTIDALRRRDESEGINVQ